MPEFNLRIRESDWARLRKHCAPSFRGRKDTEIGAIGLLGKRMMGAELRELIVTQVLWPEPGEVVADIGAGTGYLSWRMSGSVLNSLSKTHLSTKSLC